MIWGVAHGNFEDITHTATNKLQEQIISTVAGILPAGSVFRHGIKVNAAQLPAAFDQTSHDYDQLFYMLAQYGLDSVVNLHTGTAAGAYYIPGNAARGGTGTTMQNWQDWVTSVLNRYAPGGSFGNGTTVSVYGANQAMAGWVPKTRWEIWNEPNSPTGNAGDTTGPTGGMNAADCYNLLRRASLAIRTHASAHAWTPYIVGLGLATTQGGMSGYWQTIVNYGLASGTSYTVGGTTYGPNPHDFIDALGVHPYSSADPTLVSGGGNPIRVTLGAIRAYMDANGGAGKHMFISEWGWRGHNLSNRYTTPAGLANTEWEDIAHEGPGQGSQERWEMSGVDTIQAVTSWLIDGACTYQTTDNNSGADVQNLGIFYNPLAATAAGPIPDSSLKAVALAYRSKLLAAPPPSIDPIVSVLIRNGKMRLVKS
jgi:hypothetical protein